MPAQTDRRRGRPAMPGCCGRLTGSAGGLPAADELRLADQRPQRRARLGRPPAAADRHRRPGRPHRVAGLRRPPRCSPTIRPRRCAQPPRCPAVRCRHTVDRIAFRWTEAPADCRTPACGSHRLAPAAGRRSFGGQALVVSGRAVPGRRRIKARELRADLAADPQPGPSAAPGRAGCPAHPRLAAPDRPARTQAAAVGLDRRIDRG